MARLRGRLAALLLAIATAALIALGARRVPETLAAASFVPPDHPWIRLDREITAQFGFENPVVWVIAARDGTVWTNQHLARLKLLTGAVLRIPGVIATDVISLASPNLRDLRVSDGSLQPVYLMAEAPRTAEVLNALRARVEGDPLYRGTLVSADGRAAMVVANFRSAADARVIADAARALAASARDARTDVYVAGEPLVRTMRVRLGVWPWLATGLAIAAATALSVSIVGTRAVLGAALAKVLAIVWTAAALLAAGAAVLPWSAYALPYAAALAGCAALLPRDRLPWRERAALAAALAVAFGVAAGSLDRPARAMAIGGAVASLMAALASGLFCRASGSAAARSVPRPRWGWTVLAAAALAAFTAPALRISLGLAGYGQRYLPGTEGADLRAIASYFPPPTALAIRVRGEPRFVASAPALRAFDGVVGAARADPAVASAMSLADLVKLVHRSFNENDPAFAVIPDDEGLIARYLTLAYSPGFRRFVDRSLSTAAIWVYLRDDDPVALQRVLDRVRAALAANPVPNAEVDLIGGDGAGVLLMAASFRSLVRASAVWLLTLALVLWAFVDRGAARRAALGGGAVSLAMAAACGWLGVSLDLLSLPLGAMIAAAAAATLASWGLDNRSPLLLWRRTRPRFTAPVRRATLVTQGGSR